MSLRYRDLRRLGSVGTKERLKLEARAIAGILEKARAVLGPLARPKRLQEVGLEDWLRSGQAGELDVERTLENPSALPLQSLRFQIWTEAPPEKVLVLLDTSLSMRADKATWLAVAAAAVSLAVPTTHLALLAFASDLHWIQHFSERIEPEEVVRRLLEIPPGGMTHIERALRAGAEELQTRGPQGLRRTHLLLVSDGRYTEGLDPVFLAPGWDRFHTLKIGKEPWGRQVLIDAARLGGGQFFEARREEELPQVLYQAVRRLLS